jgi:EAL domain-containing protein (putative c-di-GMP-specific phosphodiesterase class I)/CheY-like chemotaxis protein
MDRPSRRTEWPFSRRWRRGTCRSTSTFDRDTSVRRELCIVVAVKDEQLRDACVDATRHNPRLDLLATSADVADTRLRACRADVVVVGGTERTENGISAIAVARDLFPQALLLPVTHDDVPRQILELAAVAASHPLVVEHSSAAPLTLENVQIANSADQPSVVFQPVVDLQDRRVIGVEALARFLVEPRNSPDAWFDAAHRVGLGVDLELTAVRKALRAAASLPRHLYVAVNVSPAAVLAPGFDAVLAGTPAEQLVLEITEHARVDDYAALRRALAPARGRGVRIAIDDVGAGFASLRHVLRLDPEIIKLDHEITRGVEHDAGRAKLVGGLIAGASAVSTLVVAEGIETEAQLRRLLELGVRGGQGYLIGRPTDLEAAIDSANAAMASLRPHDAPPVPEPEPRRALTGARILVVDDSPAHRLLFRSVFELEGATVHEVATAAAALHAIDDAEPDLVLLDVRLPDGNGFDVLEHIRRTTDIPALFVTAATAVSDRVAGLDRGADDYLLKPFSPDELVARVDAALRRRSDVGTHIARST